MFGYNLATRHRLSVHRQSAGSRPPHRSRSQARRASWVAADPSRAGARVTSCSSLTPCLTPCLTRLRVAGADNLVSVRVVTARDTRGAGPDILPKIRKKNRQFINKIAVALVYFFTVWLLFALNAFFRFPCNISPLQLLFFSWVMQPNRHHGPGKQLRSVMLSVLHNICYDVT